MRLSTVFCSDSTLASSDSAVRLCRPDALVIPETLDVPDTLDVLELCVLVVVYPG